MIRSNFRTFSSGLQFSFFGKCSNYGKCFCLASAFIRFVFCLVTLLLAVFPRNKRQAFHEYFIKHSVEYSTYFWNSLALALTLSLSLHFHHFVPFIHRKTNSCGWKNVWKNLTKHLNEKNHWTFEFLNYKRSVILLTLHKIIQLHVKFNLVYKLKRRSNFHTFYIHQDFCYG